MSEPPRPPTNPNDPDATLDPGATLEPAGFPSVYAPVPPIVPIQIEGYRLVDEISRGGQAIVYLAIFLRTGRKVAVKIMREGPLATESSRARFTREAQILASLNHPNIVTILDRGRTADGSEYFAMDYIDGKSLDEGAWKSPGYLQSISQSPADPLQLFLKVCDAVNAAHLRGIVHRDLKPSNIRLDERGEPHVLDFGLARGSMLSDSQSTHEPITITGQFLGSLPWASPEQAEGIGQKIDLRSDVYSLGVILYQLVTGGHFPYQVIGSMRDVLNNIMTAEPPAPSVIAVDREARDLKRQARRAGTPAKLVNPVLDAIVLRALAKRRDDRYQSAGELARDIESYLAGRPTVAGQVGAAAQPRRASWVLAGVAGVIIAGVVAGVIYLATRNNAATSPPISPVAAGRASGAATELASPNTPSFGRSPPPMVARSSLAAEYMEVQRILGRFTPISAYMREHAPERYAVWRAAAETGDPVGQMFVARCYDQALMVNVDYAESQSWLKLAADKGLPLAMCMEGIRMRAGINPDYEQAMMWYTRAAEAGEGRAMTDIGVMYLQGLGRPVNYEEALRWFHKSADVDTPAALSFLGDMYHLGNGVTRDYATAMEYYRRAAEAPVPNGLLGVAMLYIYGQGVPRDYVQGMDWCRRADAAGMSYAAYAIGELYANGQGVPQDYAQAAVWYQKGADASVIPAMRKLAALYEEGNGLPADRNLAVTWYTKAANAGDAEAKKWLLTNNTAPATMR